MTTIYDNVLELPEEISDGGSAMREIEAEADTYYLLKRLPKRQRAVVELLLEGYTQKEIAKKLSISTGNVSTHIKRARNLWGKDTII